MYLSELNVCGIDVSGQFTKVFLLILVASFTVVTHQHEY